MPIRTRSDMHIGLDLILEVLNATPTNRIDPAVKDFFLNRTITQIVKDVINKNNTPDETKRVPFRVLTYGDILNKYNDIYTLVKVDDTLLPTLPLVDNSYYNYILPSDLFRFEGSYSLVRPIDCITYLGAIAPTSVLSSGAGNVDNGKHYYFVTFIYPTLETDINGINVSNATVIDKTANGKIELTNIPLGLTTCTARKIYRSKVGEAWYKGRLLTTLSDNTTTVYTDNTADSSLGALYSGNTRDTQLQNVLLDLYDINLFNIDPYGGRRKLIGTILTTSGLQLHHLNRYKISKVGIFYVKKPAILTSSPEVVNCDLPESIHDRVIEETAKFIAAATANGNYEQLLMEAKQNIQ